MFVKNSKIKNFAKRQLAKLMSVVMAFSCLTSTGMVITTARADQESVNDYGQSFVEELVRITADGTKYINGGWLNPGVDCIGLVRAGLSNTYGISIFDTSGYLVDEDGNAILDQNGNRTYIDLAVHDDWVIPHLAPYVNQRICIEGNGIKTYYRVAAADYCKNLQNVCDINFNGVTYSSLIAYACQFPGSIIAHNDHYGVALGQFDSEAELIAQYPDLNGPCSGSAGGNIIRWSQAAYNYGNSYNQDDYRYWFGKTVFLSACSPQSGIRADNVTTTGKSAAPDGDSTMVVLICESKPKTTEVTFEKYDQATGKQLAGSVYGLYSDYACTNRLDTLDIQTGALKVELLQGIYYVTEESAPDGYTVSTDVVTVDATGDATTIKLYDNPTNSTVLVKKVDAHDTDILLSGTKLKIQERNHNAATPEEQWADLVDLTYSPILQAFTIDTEYTNSEDVTYSDNALHYSSTNKGDFRLVEVSAQRGYINSGYIKEFNVSEGNLKLVGDDAITNVANLSLLVNKVDIDGNPIEGATFTFIYGTGANEWKQTLTTNDKGQCLFKDIPEQAINMGKLYEVYAPAGYVPTDNLIAGQPVALSKAVRVGDYFQTEVTIRNLPDTTGDEVVEPTSGTITIEKRDLSIWDDRMVDPTFFIGVKDTYYTLYTDEDLADEHVAKDQHDNRLERLKTDENGRCVVNDLDPGIYYLREVEAPKNYALQLKTFPINLLADSASKDGTLAVTTHGVGDVRQAVQLSLKKVDELTGDPIAGAVYKLYAESDIITSITGKTIEASTEGPVLIGRYVTDDDGMIVVDRFGTPELKLSESLKFDAVSVSAEGVVVDQEGLMNGKYYFVEEYAPVGYVLDTETKHRVDATWKLEWQNTTDEDKTVDGAIVGPGGASLRMDTVIAQDKRQTVKITFSKTGVNGAILPGAVYQLINTKDIIDIVSGNVISANTVLGVYTTQENGSFVADSINIGVYAGNALPNGEYKFVEVSAPQRYARNQDPVIVDNAIWLPINMSEPQLSLTYGDTDELLKQAVEITKISTDENMGLEDVVFQLYRVEDIAAKCSLDTLWNTASAKQNGYHMIDRDALKAVIDAHNIQAAVDEMGQSLFTTNSEGKVTTGCFTYGDYILYEVAAPKGHLASDAIYIQLPWVEVTVADETYYVHDVEEQPDTPYTQTVINASNFLLTVVKTDATTRATIIDNPAQFELYDSNGMNKITQGALGDPWQTKADGAFTLSDVLPIGQYILKEVKAPNDYVASEDVTLTVTSTNAKAVLPNGELIDVEFDYDETYGILVTVFVPNTEIPKPSVLVSKYEVIDGERKAVPGATLQILDQNGDVVVLKDGTRCEWVTNLDTTHVDDFGVAGHLIDNLPAGAYTLHEANAPAGYTKAEDIPFTVEAIEKRYDIGMEEAPLTAQFSKLDAESGVPIVGAELIVLDENKNPVLDAHNNEIKWTTNGEVHTVSYLPVGTYYLRELSAPIGYQKAPDKLFVVDYDTPTIVAMSDARTYGSIELYKRDADTTDPLKGVVFELISVDEIKDPVTEQIVYTAGQVVDTMTTNRDGYAKTNANVPIGTYGQNGTFTPIKYKLIETKAAAGAQYDPSAVQCDVEFAYVNDTTPVVLLQLELDNNKPKLVVSKTGSPNTYVGDYGQKAGVTVVNNGETITYTISVANRGAATAWNVVVKDVVPANTTFVDMDKQNHGVYDAATNTVHWTIDQIPAGQTIELTFDVKVESDVACEIVNVAQYAMPEYIPVNDEDFLKPTDGDIDWQETDAVVHQVVEFHKSSIVAGGVDKETATAVAVGDTIRYRMTFTAVDDVYNVIVTDEVPDGLTYVSGSAMINGVVDPDASFHPGNKILTFSAVDLNNETIEFSFDVTVDDIEMGAIKYYENVANASYKINTASTERKTVSSEIVTHCSEKQIEVIKSGSPITFVGNAADAENVTVLQAGETVEYTLTVTNKGASAVKNIIVTDMVPSGLQYIANQTPEGVKVWVDEDTGLLTWGIAELKSEEDVVLKFTASVVEQKAQFIINAAYYGTGEKIGDNVPVLPEDHDKTNDVVHQVVEFHKTSDVLGGTDQKTATAVAIGDTITYTMELITKGNLTGVVVSDPIQDGLAFVPGSIAFKNANDEQWTALSDDCCVSDEKESVICFPSADLDAGTYYFKFAVIVKHIPVNTEKFYVNQATVTYDRAPNDAAETPKQDSLLSEEVSHMTTVKVEGQKTGTKETYVGDYESKHHVTVIEDGNEIVYTITITNTGVSDIHNLIIRDHLPEFTKFIKAENDGQFDETTGYVTWKVDTVEAGQPAIVKFVVQCDTNGIMTEIRNQASYAVPENPEMVRDDEWLWTDEVIHQTVKLRKDASIQYGSDQFDATYIPIGSKFTYIITFEASNDVYGLTVQDVIPSGLAFLPGTARYQLAEQEVVKVDGLNVGEDGVIKFPTIDQVPMGASTFMFDVVVNDVAQYDTNYYFINQASATVKESQNSDDLIELITNPVSNRTMKTNVVDTPVLGFETTSETFVWLLIAMVSAVAMIAFGIYGFSDKKKKK